MNIEFNINEDAMKTHMTQLNFKLEKVYEGGGVKQRLKQRE